MTSPVPGPPKPGQHLAPSVPTVSPDAVTQRVDELIVQVDEIRAGRAASGIDGPGVDLAALERQAVLLEQAHQILSVALEDVDRAT